MISGPTIPRTLNGVRGLIQRHLGLAERGLAMVAEDLELDPNSEAGGCDVDALARDAAGAPVLVFAAVPETGRGLSVRVLDAHAWFQRHGRFLVREFADRGLDPGLDQSLDPASVRLAVFGLDFLAITLRDLERLALAELQVFEFCSFTVGGELRVGVTPLMGGEAGPQPGEASVQTADFRVPSGLPPGPAAERCAFFLDLVRRMDPRVTACGDRFSRQIRLHGNLLAELHVTDRTPRVRVPGDGELPLDSQDACLAVVDRLVRQLLAAEEATPAPVPAPVPGPAESLPAAALPTASALGAPATPRLAPAPAAGERPEGLDEGRFSLEPIRQSVAAAKVSQDEYSALEEPLLEPPAVDPVEET